MAMLVQQALRELPVQMEIQEPQVPPELQVRMVTLEQQAQRELLVWMEIQELRVLQELPV